MGLYITDTHDGNNSTVMGPLTETIKVLKENCHPQYFYITYDKS